MAIGKTVILFQQGKWPSEGYSDTPRLAIRSRMGTALADGSKCCDTGRASVPGIPTAGSNHNAHLVPALG